LQKGQNAMWTAVVVLSVLSTLASLALTGYGALVLMLSGFDPLHADRLGTNFGLGIIVTFLTIPTYLIVTLAEIGVLQSTLIDLCRTASVRACCHRRRRHPFLSLASDACDRAPDAVMAVAATARGAVVTRMRREEILVSDFQKLSLTEDPNQRHIHRRPGPQRGAFGHRRERWGGMRWTRLRRRALLARGRTAQLRTAKSCGPDTPTLVSSS
jgi:hypothetical protein